LRFDFSQNRPVTADEILAVEDMVNSQIRANSEVETDLMGYEAAIERGAMALFGEKYGDQVRVLSMGGDYSVELCGGTHVDRTGDIGLFKVTAEMGIAAGVRRIEAVTGEGALSEIRATDVLINSLAALLKCGRNELAERVESLVSENKQLAKQMREAGEKLAASQGSDLARSAIDMDGVKFLASEVQGDNEAMMQTLDNLRSQLSACVVVLAHVRDGKVGLVVGVSKTLIERIKAPEVLAVVGPLVGAKGGGRPDLARAGGGDKPQGLAEAFSAAQAFVAARFG